MQVEQELAAAETIPLTAREIEAMAKVARASVLQADIESTVHTSLGLDDAPGPHSSGR